MDGRCLLCEIFACGGVVKPFKLLPGVCGCSGVAVVMVTVVVVRGGAVMFLYNDSVLGNDFSYGLYMNKAFISKSGQPCGLRMALTC